VRSKPGVNGGFDSAPRTIVRNWLKIGEVDVAVGYFGMASADVFFSEAALPDVFFSKAALPDTMAFLSAEGASIGVLASSEERLGVVTLLS